MFTAFIEIVHHASLMGTGPCLGGLICFLAWPICALIVVPDRPVVLRATAHMLLMLSASAIADPPSAQK